MLAYDIYYAFPNYIKLSVNIEVFKCHLKTYLLKESYILFLY